MRLSNKIAFVTGGSRGIGKAIAIDLASQGAEVLFTYKSNREKAEEVAREIFACGNKCEHFQLDVTSREQIRQLRDLVQENYGQIDILINNAGINKPNDFDKINDEDWEEVLQTNLASVFRMGQEFYPVINKGGAIINISSVSGQYGGPRTTHYAVSKGGLFALTQNMAIFMAKKNIRVNAVSPGLIESEMAAAANRLGIDDKILLKRRGAPQEVARVVSFLASDDASYITAQTINVNGGLYF